MSENLQNLDMCPRCMTPLNGNKICPHCHLELDTYTPAKHHLPPRTILDGKYLVGCVLGEGGFGITYVGWDLQLHTMVAIKEYFPTGIVIRDNSVSNVLTVYSGNGEKYFLHDRDKFLREAQMLAKFGGNPGVVDVKNYFKENGTAYIVMEYVQGINLDAYTEQNGGKLPLSLVLNLLETPIKTLGEMHQSRTYHRDLSPENMMVTESGTVKLIDFGSTMTIQKDKSTTTLKVRAGYSPIELYTMSGQEGPFSDIYALSATIYKTITGIAPPAATDRIEEDHLIPPIRAGAKGITPEQEKVLMKGLAVKAQDRYQRVEDLYRDLKNAANAKGGTGKTRLYALIAACAAVLALVIFGLTSLQKPEKVAITEESFGNDTALYEMYKRGDFRECTAAITPEGIRIVRYDTYTKRIDNSKWDEPVPMSAQQLKAHLDALEEDDLWESMGNLLVVGVKLDSLEPFRRDYKGVNICLEFHHCVLPEDMSPLASIASSLYEFGVHADTVLTCANLEFLREAERVSVLDVTFDPEKTVDLSAIEGLKRLTILRLRNVAVAAEQLENWKPNWSRLEILSLVSTGLTDVSVLSDLPALQELNLHDNEISDVSALKDMAALKQIDISGNRIADASVLEAPGRTIQGADQQKE